MSVARAAGRRAYSLSDCPALLLMLAIAAPLYLFVYRPLQLRWGATDAEVAQRLPGDDMSPAPLFNATRAITIAAPPAAVWPWLAQIGYQRAGWYSGLDWFDNAGVPSADRIVPELQHLKVGDTFPIWEGVTQTVIAVEPNRYLLTASERPNPDTWVWVLVPTDDGQTRLLWRMHNATYDWTSPFVVAQLATDLGDFFFVRNILLGVQERVEGRPIESLAATDAAVCRRRAGVWRLPGEPGGAGRPPGLAPAARRHWRHLHGHAVAGLCDTPTPGGHPGRGRRLRLPVVATSPAPLERSGAAPPDHWSGGMTPRAWESARTRPGAPISGSSTARLGFWSAVVAASASLGFLVASVPVLLGAVAPPWDNVLTLLPSLLLAPALLVLLVCVHHAAPDEKKVWSHLAVAFGGVYTALVCVVYVVSWRWSSR